MLFLVACKKTQDSLLKILDCTLWIQDSRYWIPRFWIPRSGSRIVLDSKILESTPWIPDSRYWIPHSLSVELGFWIPVVTPELNSGFHDSRIPVQSPDFSFRKQTFPGLPYLERFYSLQFCFCIHCYHMP